MGEFNITFEENKGSILENIIHAAMSDYFKESPTSITVAEVEAVVSDYMNAHPVDGVDTEEVNSLIADYLTEHPVVGQKGDKGDKGDTGAQGATGANGASAYGVAVANGYEGTEEEWLLSLKGAKGAKGDTGADGKSAYEIAVENGFEGTEAEWLESLQGDGNAEELQEQIDDCIKNPYKGKKVVHMGDSWIQLYGLAEGVADKIGYNVINVGFQATAIGSSVGKEAATNARKFSLIELAKAIRDNAWTEQDAISGNDWQNQLQKLKAIDWATVDVLILSYGINDFGVQNPIGDVEARDEESVCGALKAALGIFNAINPDMEIIVTTPCYRYIPVDNQTMASYNGGFLIDQNEYRNAIGLTAQYCGVKLIDMRALSGINELNHETTLLSDGLHPTTKGVEMWVNAFSEALKNGYAGAFDVSNAFSFESDNLCFDSEKLTKHKKWNASYTLDGIKYLCTRRNRQFGEAVLGMKYFDTIPTGTVISMSGHGRKTSANGQRIGFYIFNADKTTQLGDHFTGNQFKETDDMIAYSYTTDEEYTDCWIVFYVKQMTAWEDGKALVRDMICKVG